MRVSSFDKLAGAAIALSLLYTIRVAATWHWFPTPGDWGDIARIPKSLENYVALLLTPVIVLIYLVVRRIRFKW